MSTYLTSNKHRYETFIENVDQIEKKIRYLYPNFIYKKILEIKD